MRLAAVLLALASLGSARADELSEGIDSIKVKLKAGRAEEALQVARDLAARHPQDPRLPYHEAQALVALDRREEAMGAVERAAAGLEAWKAANPAAPEAKEIETFASDQLKHRRAARRALATYRTAALASFEKLLAPAPGLAYYLLEELDSALEASDPELPRLAKRVPADARAERSKERARAVRRPTSDDERLRADRNADEAEKALKTGKADEARIAALAALELDTEHLRGLIALADALERLGKRDEALTVLLRSLDAPKPGDVDLKAIKRAHTESLRKLKGWQPDLHEAVLARATALREVLKVSERAGADGRPHDVAWLGGLGARVGPGEPALAEAFPRLEVPVRRTPRLEGGGGFVDLLSDPEAWEWYDAPKRKVRGKTIEIRPDPAAHVIPSCCPPRHMLPSAFTLQLQVQWRPRPGGSPVLWFIFERAAGRQDNRALAIGLEGEVRFARMEEAWVIGKSAPLPREAVPPGRPILVEVRWSRTPGNLRLLIDGKERFDVSLPAADAIDGPWEIGFSGGEELVLSAARFKAGPPE